jgi:transcriptional regulator with XRE-family HTH domain
MTITPERASRTLSDLIAEEIRVALTRQRMSQRQFAARLGVSPAWLNYRLTGVQEIGVNDLNRIAKALGMSVFALMPPAEQAAGAADARTTHGYATVPVEPVSVARPKDNRPSGHPGAGSTATIGRTTYLARPAQRRRDR